jgi:hypothetical protein
VHQRQLRRDPNSEYFKYFSEVGGPSSGLDVDNCDDKTKHTRVEDAFRRPSHLRSFALCGNFPRCKDGAKCTLVHDLRRLTDSISVATLKNPERALNSPDGISVNSPRIKSVTARVKFVCEPRRAAVPVKNLPDGTPPLQTVHVAVDHHPKQYASGPSYDARPSTYPSIPSSIALDPALIGQLDLAIRNKTKVWITLQRNGDTRTPSATGPGMSMCEIAPCAWVNHPVLFIAFVNGPVNGKQRIVHFATRRIIRLIYPTLIQPQSHSPPPVFSRTLPIPPPSDAHSPPPVFSPTLPMPPPSDQPEELSLLPTATATTTTTIACDASPAVTLVDGELVLHALTTSISASAGTAAASASTSATDGLALAAGAIRPGPGLQTAPLMVESSNANSGLSAASATDGLAIATGASIRPCLQTAPLTVESSTTNSGWSAAVMNLAPSAPVKSGLEGKRANNSVLGRLLPNPSDDQISASMLDPLAESVRERTPPWPSLLSVQRARGYGQHSKQYRAIIQDQDEHLAYIANHISIAPEFTKLRQLCAGHTLVYGANWRVFKTFPNELWHSGRPAALVAKVIPKDVGADWAFVTIQFDGALDGPLQMSSNLHPDIGRRLISSDAMAVAETDSKLLDVTDSVSPRTTTVSNFSVSPPSSPTAQLEARTVPPNSDSNQTQFLRPVASTS